MRSLVRLMQRAGGDTLSITTQRLPAQAASTHTRFFHKHCPWVEFQPQARRGRRQHRGSHWRRSAAVTTKPPRYSGPTLPSAPNGDFRAKISPDTRTQATLSQPFTELPSILREST